MPSLSKWVGSTDAIEASQRAVEAWRRIQRNPTSVVLRRAGSNLTAQTLRIEAERTQAQSGDLPIGEKPRARAVVFGIKNHPTASDTTIVQGDRFVYQNVEYRVVNLSWYPGEIQAQCEAVE